MGDRFYMSQGKTISDFRGTQEVAKPKRRLKADIVEEIRVGLAMQTGKPVSLPGLAKCDNATLEELLQLIGDY